MTKKTEKILSSLDWAIAQSNATPKAEDEFTAFEYAQRVGITSAQALNRLKNMKGIKKRAIILNGTRTNVYTKA